MNNPFTFESESFDYSHPGGGVATELDEQEAWETSSPFAEELGEAEAEAAAASEVSSKPASRCPGYQPGEVKKSFTAQGLLPSDVILHSRGLLIADFGVDWRTPRKPLRGDKTLKDWLASIGPVIQSNPSTTIRILGFSDCVGRERNNRLLRAGRATRVANLLKEMFGSNAQWNVVKAKIKFIGAAPANDYISTNATVEGRAQNRSVLIESKRTIDFDPQVVKSCKFTAQQAATYPLLGLIPNVPDYQRYVPHDYRLNAKNVVGKVAQDVSTSGKKAHFWIDLVHWGLLGAEIAAEASLIVGALSIAGPILLAVGNIMALGLPCLEAAEIVAKKSAAHGFSRGVVMGADGRSAQLLKDYFGNEYFPPNHFCPQARDVAIANYKMGLLVGYVNGRVLCPNQRAIFWRDLGRRMGNMSHLGDRKTWGRRQWVDWYVTAAAIFRKHHLTD